MLRVAVVLVLLCATFHVSLSLTDGLLPNGDFEFGPKPSEIKGTKVTNKNAIPNWEVSGIIEYIKSGHKQGDMLLVVPNGKFAVRLGNEASIKQKVKVVKNSFYSLTFSAARTCAQEEKLNVSVSPNTEPEDWGILPMQTMYSSDGWDSYAWGFLAESNEIDISIHNPGVEEDAACGPLIDSVALKVLTTPKRTRENMLKNGVSMWGWLTRTWVSMWVVAHKNMVDSHKESNHFGELWHVHHCVHLIIGGEVVSCITNGNFEEGPYVFPNTSWGVLVPPNIEDNHSPLPGWMIESLKAVKYIDSNHYAVPEGKRAVELVAGKESAIAQVVKTTPGKVYALTFSVGDANNACEGSMVVEAFAGKVTLQVPYQSKGKGGFTRGKLHFRAVSARTRVRFLSTFYTMKNDHSGALCGPVIDNVKLLGVRYARHG